MQTIAGLKYSWTLPQFDIQQALDISRTYNMALPVAQALVARGFTRKEHIESYLFTSSDCVTHPSQLKDAQKSVDRIIQAIERQEKILIAGDYDVDGITASALMMQCLLPLGAQVNFFLPNRVRDGYGLSVKVIERAVKNNYKLIITVDNGITAFEPARIAKEAGIDLIITDHHRPQGAVPDAYAIVNPHQADCGYPYKYFAGVGVIFKVLSLLYETVHKPLPSKAYELLLLGTIADVVPLTGENRYWVRQGLSWINEQESFALRILKQNGNIHKPYVSELDIGYSITPQINALGRLEDARQGVEFLIGSHQPTLSSIGAVLLELNQARKKIEQSVLKDIISWIESGTLNIDQEPVIIAAHTQWPAGVIGLVASRLVGAYNRPALIFHKTDNGILKGSARSIPAFNMFEALQSARHLLYTFGGHSVAAGLSLAQEQLPALKEHLWSIFKEQITPAMLEKKIAVDACISLTDITPSLMHSLDLMRPFGHENPQPVFCVRRVSLVQPPTLLKQEHTKCLLFAEGMLRPIIFFNRPDIFERLRTQGSDPFDVVGHVTQNYWNERVSLELQGIDIAF